jgi:hypothetical protein
MDEDYGYDAPREISLWRAISFLDLDDYLPFVLFGALVSAMVLYWLLRSRANREGIADPQLGWKFALGYFRVLAFHILLLGGVALVFGIIMKSQGLDKEMIYRPALGFMVPAGLLFGVHTWALTRTNQAEQPMVGRLLAGFSLIVSGVLGSLALFVVFQLLFEKGASGNQGRFFWSLFLVYGTAWVVQAVRFYKRVQIDPLLAPPMPAFYPPPPAVAMQAPLAAPPVPGAPVAPTAAPVVPLPGPMAAPLAPPGSAPGSGSPGGTTL